MAGLSGFNKAWVEAAAALPPGWELKGIVKGPREVDPRIDSHDWVAWAKPNRDDANHQAIGKVEGRGPTEIDALHVLRNALKDLGR